MRTGPHLSIPTGILTGILLIGTLHGPAVTAAEPDFRESRARITESKLRDLSRQNEAGLKSILTTPRPAPAPGQRVDLSPEGPPEAAVLVRGDVQFSLNRLRRETASARTADGRKARIDESMDRQVMDGVAGSPATPAVTGRPPEFAPMQDARFDLRPEDHPLNVSVRDDGPVDSSLHRLNRAAGPAEDGAEPEGG